MVNLNLDNYKSRELVPVTCHACGKKFHRTKHQIQKSIRLKQNLYCSKKCIEKNHEVECKNCGDVFIAKDKSRAFCSHTCSAIYNNLRRNKKEKTNCVECGEKTNNPKYCSIECFHKNRWTLLKNSIDKKDLRKSIKGNKQIKRYLSEIRGRKCEICETEEWMGKEVPLILDHINGNSDDNSIENLRLVCGNCDMQLPTYKAKNRGNGRHYRRQRYAEGKSY